MIFPDISDFKKYVGGAVNHSMDLESMAPAFHRVVQDQIIPLVGEDLWKLVLDGYETVTEGVIFDLLPYVKRPLALLATWNHASVGGVQFSDSGLYRVEGENNKTAYKYQENQYKDSQRDAGFEALEELQLFLVAKADDYETFKNTEEHKAALSMLLNTARTFKKLYGRQVSRYIFENLKAILKNVEIFVVEPAIGEGQHQLLLDGVFAGDLNDKSKTLLQKLQRALTNFAIEEGLIRQFIQIQGDKVVKQEGLEPQTLSRQGAPSLTELFQAKRYHQFEAQRHLKKALDYLNTNLDDFPEYKSFYEANLEAEKVAEEERIDLSTPTTSKGGLIRF